MTWFGRPVEGIFWAEVKVGLVKSEVEFTGSFASCRFHSAIRASVPPAFMLWEVHQMIKIPYDKGVWFMPAEHDYGVAAVNA
jgi:hypothetical protein